MRKKERDLLLCLLKDKSQVKNTSFPISTESITRFNIVHDAVGNPHTALKQKIILTYPVSFIGYFNQIIIGASICHLTVSLSTVLNYFICLFSLLVRRFLNSEIHLATVHPLIFSRFFCFIRCNYNRKF